MGGEKMWSPRKLHPGPREVWTLNVEVRHGPHVTLIHRTNAVPCSQSLVLHFPALLDERSWRLWAFLSQVFFGSGFCLMLALFLLHLRFALPFVGLERDRDGERERSRLTPFLARWLADSMPANVWRLWPPFHTHRNFSTLPKASRQLAWLSPSGHEFPSAP